MTKQQKVEDQNDDFYTVVRLQNREKIEEKKEGPSKI